MKFTERLHRLFAGLFMLVSQPFRPSFWRYLCYRETKVRVYLKSGNYVDVHCESWEVTIGRGSTDGCSHYKFTGMRKVARFDITQIEAVRAR